MKRPVIQTLGEGALVMSAGADASIECQQRLWAIAHQASAWPHVRDVVPGMNNLTLLFDPLAADTQQLSDRLHKAWEIAAVSRKAGKKVEIPVVYGGDSGPDLEQVAHYVNLSTDEVIRRHTATEYVVYFIGFQPGFPYLGGLDPQLHVPRRSAPRLVVPAGSVGIGGSQTGIYPAASPGGWQLIGRSDLQLFDPDKTPPTLLQPGDRVCFVDSRTAA